MIKIQEVRDKKVWESFLITKEIVYYPFFQSWNWGEVQKQLGFDVVRLGTVDEKGNLLGVCQILDIRAKRGHYLHLRHGPVFLKTSGKNINEFLQYIKDLALHRKAAFLRISPLIHKSNKLTEVLERNGSVNAPIHNMDAEVCWLLDITKPDDQLLQDMRKTHRYLIRKSLNMDIKIIRSKNVSDIDKFIPLYLNLSQKKHFVPHVGILEEFKYFTKDDQAILYLAKYKGRIISGALISFVGNMAIYRHSASSQEYKNIPASYLIQWEAIKDAKAKNKKYYNFWGIAPKEKEDHPWQGITLFKTGFGGRKEEFLHAQDIPLNFLYWFTYGIDLFTKLRKGY